MHGNITHATVKNQINLIISLKRYYLKRFNSYRYLKFYCPQIILPRVISYVIAMTWDNCDDDYCLIIPMPAVSDVNPPQSAAHDMPSSPYCIQHGRNILTLAHSWSLPAALLYQLAHIYTFSCLLSKP